MALKPTEIPDLIAYCKKRARQGDYEAACCADALEFLSKRVVHLETILGLKEAAE